MEEGPLGVSKVLHIRNLPDNVSEREMVSFGLQFGNVSNVLLLRAKNQAFIEMCDSNTASTMLNFCAKNPATIRLVTTSLLRPLSTVSTMLTLLTYLKRPPLC